MTRSPDIAWFQRRWALPAAAIPQVEKLLYEEERGGTACLLDQPSVDWSHATAGDFSPLVLIPRAGKTYLQSRRLFQAERFIARRILALAKRTSADWNQSAGHAAIFSGTSKDDRQAAAARTALTHHLSLITGGPGTGKTYTLARILALLASRGIPEKPICLAAPTGKAADRMKAAVSDSLSGLPSAFQSHLPELRRIAMTSSTLHKLLAYHPVRGCGYGPGRELPCSVLIVDECSMVDVLLWRALLAALPADARLILLGDPNQLESVGKGNVFAELVRASADANAPLYASHVHLTEARRFKGSPSIAALARAVETSDAVSAAALLEAAVTHGNTSGLTWIPSSQTTLRRADFPPKIIEDMESVAYAPSPETALDALGKICILTAQKNFASGAIAVGEEMAAWFSMARNHPIIINRNDAGTGLRNGSVGVIHRREDGRTRAFFRSVHGGLSEYAVASLPEFSPAWAITIHRSQGGEYDSVFVILPHEDSPMTTKELLYTAITRARHRLTVYGTLASVKKAVATPSQRLTLLASHLSAG